MIRLYLIRHGETDHNRNRRLQGHGELPLNDEGVRQATRLARRLVDFPITKIISSDIRRAAMTAAIIASHTGAPLEFEPLWRERNPGELAGLSYDEAASFFTDDDYEPPGGESPKVMNERIDQAVARLIEREYAPKPARSGEVSHIAVVSHGMACASFLNRHFEGVGKDLAALRWRNASLTLADYDGRWRLITLADATHLDDLEQAAAG